MTQVAFVGVDYFRVIVFALLFIYIYVIYIFIYLFFVKTNLTLSPQCL